MVDYKTTGGCYCGGIKYEITKPPFQVHYCHCTMCRKFTGADFSTNGAVPKEHFKLIKCDTLKEYHSSQDATRVFCGVCGCAVMAKGRPDGKLSAMKCVFVFFGGIDGDPDVRPAFHIFVKDKGPWVKINDGLPQSNGHELLNFAEFMQ